MISNGYYKLLIINGQLIGVSIINSMTIKLLVVIIHTIIMVIEFNEYLASRKLT